MNRRVSTTGMDKLGLSDRVPSSITFMKHSLGVKIRQHLITLYFLNYASNLYCIQKTIKILADKQVFEFLVYRKR